MKQQEPDLIRKATLFSREFPLMMRQFSHTREDYTDPNKLHIREFWKIFHVESGRGRYLSDGREFTVVPGTICVVHPDSRTTFLPEGDSPLVVYNICFLPSLVENELESLSDLRNFFTIFDRRRVPRGQLYQVQYVIEAARPVTALIRRMKHEFEMEHPDYRCMLKLQLQELLLLLARAGMRQFRTNRHESIAAFIDQLIDEEFTGTFDYARAAESLQLTQSALCINYRRARGCTITEALKRRRLACAVELLERSTKPVSEICFLAGFRDPSYFHRTFRDATGKTPGEWRSQRFSKAPAGQG